MNGSTAEVELTVADGDTAIAHRSGDVPVLATPRVLALAEEAAVAAVVDQISEGRTSVGIHVELHHVKASTVGSRVVARAEAIDQSGGAITFEFTVSEGGETIAYGTHKRVLVDRDRFVS